MPKKTKRAALQLGRQTPLRCIPGPTDQARKSAPVRLPLIQMETCDHRLFPFCGQGSHPPLPVEVCAFLFGQRACFRFGTRSSIFPTAVMTTETYLTTGNAL